ncbi:putative membrane protein [Litorivivens lipolytica]|uniref:Putative membrane protein n=1 Tax=Litorivivens lipolytica TaxID=1524264 RepID=A0A7W4W763_9GAMM|nr:NnrU family protein [Litorivivens lipolytica]MBB3048743.1 putative membrane protein [Litorivivens lipolytica]
MSLLIGGILLWVATHFSIRLLPGMRQQLISAIGKWPYQGVFSVVMVVAIVLIVRGWKEIGPGEPLWLLDWARPVNLVLMAAAVCLFIAANAPTDIKQVLRHPQLLSVVIWALAHLLVNSDLRSLVLFGSLAVWALAEMALINHHAGPWQKPAPSGAAKTVVSVVIGLAVFAVLLYVHPWLAGVAVI